jgi:putative heme iron utilization protein
MTGSEWQDLQSACDELILQQQTLLLSTLSADLKTDISYAPYIKEGNDFYIFVSELASHTQNLGVHPQAAILFIEPESLAANPFARKRLTLDCAVTEIGSAESDFDRVLRAMVARFGSVVGVLRTLPDFHLFCLRPVGGRFVAGFGKAYAVDATGRLLLEAPLGSNGLKNDGLAP